MAKVVTDNQYYTAIANAIRALTGSSGTYTPAEMAPAIIGYIAGVDLSEVESYFITDVVNAMKYVKQLGTDDWVHHIVITDIHFCRNYGHSTAIVKAMQDSGYFSKLINLGDIADTADEADYTTAIANYSQFNGNMLFAIGNHDVQTPDYESVYYDAFLSESTDLVFENGSTNFNYYWDDDTHKIRYIVYNYGSNSGGDAYALARMGDAPSGYSIITFCHYRNHLKDSAPVVSFGEKLNYIGDIAGHTHFDILATVYDNQYVSMTLMNDGMTNDKEPYIKTDGTNDSQAITIMSINTATKTVKFRRIGIAGDLGKSWQYSYKQGGSVDKWLGGYYWDTATVASVESGFLYPIPMPAVDANGTPITYRIYTKSGLPVRAYVLGLRESGELVSGQRLSAPFSSVFNRVGFLEKSTSGSQPFAQSVYRYLLSINTDGNLASADDIVVTTDGVPLGVSFENVTWESGLYLSSSNTEVTDEAGVTSYAFDVLPNTTYRFYVDEADWSTSYMCAFVFSDSAQLAKNIINPKWLKRVGSTVSGTTEITFKTTADTKYCRISVRNVANVIENWQSKCHLEVVTA